MTTDLYTRLLRVTCRRICNRPYEYQARLEMRPARKGFTCARCGEQVPLAGDDHHAVEARRGD